VPERSPIPILRHAKDDQPGYITEALERFSLPFTITDLYADSSPDIPLRDVPALIVLGGPQSVNAGLDFLEREKRLIAEALSMDKPVLAVCLGSQLLASVLGEGVFRIREPEIGWFPVKAAARAVDDPLFFDWAEQTVFHWHSEGYKLPSGSTLLASSDGCEVQAFRHGKRQWGVQFHPEVTPAIIATWCQQDAACPEDRELAGPLDPQWNAESLRGLANRLFDRWAQMVIEQS
jgi:GMP synthase (glutamine-hydrolysing)